MLLSTSLKNQNGCTEKVFANTISKKRRYHFPALDHDIHFIGIFNSMKVIFHRNNLDKMGNWNIKRFYSVHVCGLQNR